MSASRRKLIVIDPDDSSVIQRSSAIEQERRVTVYDILEYNDFSLVEGGPGPYRLSLGMAVGKYV